MDDIESLIDTYPVLTPEEREAVEARVAAAPEWAAALDHARRFAALLDAAAPPAPPRPSGDGQPVDPEAESARTSARLRELVRETEDPIQRFERLTGRAPMPPAVASTPPRPGGRAGRWIAGAALVLFLAWGGAAVASGVATPERARVADMGALADYRPLARSDVSVLEGQLADALNAVDAARRTRLGRAPEYDADALAAAADHLDRIAADAEEGSAVQQEAQLGRGRVLLHLGRDVEAARALGALVRDGGYRAPEARRLLDWLRAERGGGAENAV